MSVTYITKFTDIFSGLVSSLNPFGFISSWFNNPVCGRFFIQNQSYNWEYTTRDIIKQGNSVGLGDIQPRGWLYNILNYYFFESASHNTNRILGCEISGNRKYITIKIGKNEKSEDNFLVKGDQSITIGKEYISSSYKNLTVNPPQQKESGYLYTLNIKFGGKKGFLIQKTSNYLYNTTYNLVRWDGGLINNDFNNLQNISGFYSDNFTIKFETSHSGLSNYPYVEYIFVEF